MLKVAANASGNNFRNAYAEKVGFIADLAHKTRRLVEQNASQGGLGSLTKSVTFDVRTLDALRGEKDSPEGKVFNLVRGLQKDLESRNTTGLAAMDLLAALPADSGLSPNAFAVFWRLRDEKAIQASGIDPMDLGREFEKLLKRFANARVNPDEQRQLRAALYRPLRPVGKEHRARLVELIMDYFCDEVGHA